MAVAFSAILMAPKDADFVKAKKRARHGKQPARHTGPEGGPGSHIHSAEPARAAAEAGRPKGKNITGNPAARPSA